MFLKGNSSGQQTHESELLSCLCWKVPCIQSGSEILKKTHTKGTVLNISDVCSFEGTVPGHCPRLLYVAWTGASPSSAGGNCAGWQSMELKSRLLPGNSRQHRLSCYTAKTSGSVKGEFRRGSLTHIAAMGDMTGAWADREASKQRAGRAVCSIHSGASILFC